jgi:Delta3-Delta2-enoyl-CoA isomerase
MAGRRKRMLNRIGHDDIIELCMARPPVNALDPEMVAALNTALDAAAEDARAVILSGQPGLFSAGLDIKALLALDRAQMSEFWDAFFGLLRRLATLDVPVIAALTGHSPAGGTVMSIFCDERVMAAGEFRMGLNEVQVGMAMPPIIHAGVQRLVGTRQAERLCVGGLLIGPDEALRLGLIDEVAPPEEVVPRAIARARLLLSLPPAAMTRTRRMCRADLAGAFSMAGMASTDDMNDGWFSDETQATMKAVLAQLAAKK